jgi:pyridoxal phosphate enzyme (YggS family)
MNEKLIKKLPHHVTCIGVSKNRSLNEIQEAFDYGIKYFGENKAQELLSKATHDQPWEWHFIGHCQTNKVKSILPFISCIHSVDSKRLLDVIEKEASSINKIIQVLLQINLTLEDSKYGMIEAEVFNLIKLQEHYPHCLFKGIMVMGPASLDLDLTHQVFEKAQNISTQIKKHSPHMDWLSMGMSDDFEVAIKYGATHVRLGRILFEE